MAWVGELVNYELPYEYTIREFEQLVDQAVRLNMVLDVHTELEEMDYIIGKFPKATIVFPHFGDGKEFEHIFKRIDAVAKHPPMGRSAWADQALPEDVAQVLVVGSVKQ